MAQNPSIRKTSSMIRVINDYSHLLQLWGGSKLIRAICNSGDIELLRAIPNANQLLLKGGLGYCQEVLKSGQVDFLKTLKEAGVDFPETAFLQAAELTPQEYFLPVARYLSELNLCALNVKVLETALTRFDSEVIWNQLVDGFGCPYPTVFSVSVFSESPHHSLIWKWLKSKGVGVPVKDVLIVKMIGRYYSEFMRFLIEKEEVEALLCENNGRLFDKFLFLGRPEILIALMQRFPKMVITSSDRLTRCLFDVPVRYWDQMVQLLKDLQVFISEVVFFLLLSNLNSEELEQHDFRFSFLAYLMVCGILENPKKEILLRCGGVLMKDIALSESYCRFVRAHFD